MALHEHKQRDKLLGMNKGGFKMLSAIGASTAKQSESPEVRQIVRMAWEARVLGPNAMQGIRCGSLTLWW